MKTIKFFYTLGHSIVNLISYTLVLLIIIFYLSESVEAGILPTKLGESQIISTILQNADNDDEKISQQVGEAELSEDLKSNTEKLDEDDEIVTTTKASDQQWRQAYYLYQTAMQYQEDGFIQQAINHYKYAYIFYNSDNIPDSIGGRIACLDKIGLLNVVLGNEEAAFYSYNHILKLARSTGDKKSESTVFIKMGIAHAFFEEIQQALVAFNQALSISNSISDTEGQAYAFYNLGTTNLKLGEKEKALSYFNQALPLFQTVGNLERTNATLEYIQSIL